MLRMSFLTREERLVFLTLSVCLIAGGLFQFVSSVFELPKEITPPQDNGSSDERGELSSSVFAPEDTEPMGNRIVLSKDDVDSLITYHEDGKAMSGKDNSPRAGSSRTGNLALSAKLDINKATAAELEALPGIGPSLAARIVEQRRAAGGFRSVEDLLTVRGIGQKTLAKFRQWVYVLTPG